MAEIYVNYGSDPVAMTLELLEQADIRSRVRPDMRVVLKPNLVVARLADGGATTHPEIAEGVIRYLRQWGVKDIVIAEGSWVGDSTARAWKNCGYARLSETYGVPLVDTKRDKVRKFTAKGLELGICETILGADYLINLPVLKGHCQTGLTCCLKNMKGCIPDGEKRRYHTLGLDEPIAALATLLKPQLHIIDGICGDPTFEEGGNPVESGRVILGFDPVLLDSYGAALMGYAPDEIGHLRLARKHGVGRYASGETEILELNAENKPEISISRSGLVRRLASRIEEDGACSACYAALICALNRTRSPVTQKIKIGQGFKGRELAGIGVGNCTAGCGRHVPGCPPSALDIARFLESL